MTPLIFILHASYYFPHLPIYCRQPLPGQSIKLCSTRSASLSSSLSLLHSHQVSLIIGFLSDKWNRKYLYIFVVLLGMLPCLATWWVTTYSQLFWLRTITGIAVGGAFPLIMSIFGDMYSSDSRAIVASLVTVATGAGQFLGAGLAGYAGPVYGWRFPFIATAIPSIVLAFLAIFLMVEPPPVVELSKQC